MRDKVFLDTNVLVYLYSSSEPTKRSLAMSLVEQNDAVVSTQVLSELANVLLRKLALPVDAIERAIEEVTTACDLVLVTPATVRSALQVCARYRFAFFDSQILAAAMAAGARTVYSEDMQHGQVVEGLRIASPFATAARERTARYRVRTKLRRAA
jgi:predicted nucleic acid-binding protein